MKWPANRITQSSPKSFGMYEKAMVLMAQGQELIHLEVGRPNFDTPLHIKEAAKKALDDGIVHYGEFAGELKLRQAISDKLKSFNKIEASPDEILVTNGLTHAAYAVFMAALDEGDEVILLEPYYPQHINKIELAGGKVITALLDKENDFQIDRTAIESRITDKTRMICMVNPANPTGRVYRRDELQIIADLAIEHDLMVISDEVYEQITYDDHQHISIATMPGMWERTFSMFAYTKAFSMDGWRLGYVACKHEFMPALMKITVNDVAHVNVFIQHGAHAALTGPQDCLAEMLREDDRRRKMVCRRLNEIKGVVCPSPQGTIYAFPDVSAFGKPSLQIAEEILAETHVVVEDGTFYGPAGEGRLRICFGAEPYETIVQAMDRLHAYFEK
ncbi:MAG: pyridoxal phosphate-dependent aminotransferase [Proteobacteria bacterium]|nr:pyridoxal phosphate-dependent aminotransferase [Pseudomonadota bacterium]